jgi:hypothetical protein
MQIRRNEKQRRAAKLETLGVAMPVKRNSSSGFSNAFNDPGALNVSPAGNTFKGFLPDIRCLPLKANTPGHGVAEPFPL